MKLIQTTLEQIYTKLSDRFFSNIDYEFDIEDKESIIKANPTVTFPVPYDYEKF